MSMINLIDAISMMRKFRGYLAGAGGISDMMGALKWSVWYAVKWWSEARASGRTESIVAKALYRSLLHHGYINERGDIIKRINAPERPRGSYAQEWLNLHEAFDAIFPKVLEGTAGEALELLLDSMQSQGWYKLWRDGFLEASGFAPRGLLEPRTLGGYNAVDIVARYKPNLYVGTETDRGRLEPLVSILQGVVVNACRAEGVCIFIAHSVCDIADKLRDLPIDSVLLFNKIHWFPNPVGELMCLKKAAPSALFYVGQPVVETMPGFLAINTALGAYHVFSRKEVENILSAAGLKVKRVLLREIPFYASIWS